MAADQKVVVKKAGHPAAHRKVRCPSCRQGYAVGDTRSGLKCSHCGHTFTLTTLR